MKKQILLAFLFSFTYLGLIAQPECPPAGTPAPSTSCEDAPLFCDGIPDGYCFSTGAPYVGTNPGAFCGGNSSVQNNQWFSFIAGTPTIDLEISVGACANGQGLQGLVYDDCGPPWVTVSNCFFQMGANSVQTFNLTGLNPGSVYYLMIDGFSGDMCDYELNTTGGSTVGPPIGVAGTITGPLVVCPGADAQTYTIPPVSGAGFYEWTITGGGVIVGNDDENTVMIDWGNSSGGTITVTPNNVCNQGMASAPIVVVSQAPPPNPPQSETMCQGDPAVVIEGESYNWAPGINVYQNMNAMNALGCPILTEVTIIGALDMTENLDPFVICDGDPGPVVGGQTFTNTGPISVTIPTALGCDSMITSYLTVLEPQAGIDPTNEIVTCSGNVTLNAIVINQDPSVMYSWSGPCIEPDGFPTDPNITVSCGGTYTLNVIESQDGVTCISDPFSVVVGEDLTPPIADAGPDVALDCSGPTVSIGGPNTTPGALYSWINTIPGNGYTSTVANPNDVTQPGTYCLTVFNLANGCPSQQPDCVVVTGDITLPTAMASTDNPTLTCTNGSATLDPSGSTTGNVTYQWFDSNNNPLTGSNPTVNQAGTYTLVVTNNDTQCESDPDATVTIGEDLTPPSASIGSHGDLDCATGTVTLDAGGSSGNGLSYSWSTGGTSQTETVSMAGQVTLTVTGSNGCQNMTTTTINDISTTIEGDIDVQGQLTCTNNMVTLTAIGVTGTNTPTYVWTDPNGNVIPNTSNSSTITVSNSGTYTLVVQDLNNNCSSDVAMETVDENNALPTAVAGANFITIDCNNENTILDPTGSSVGNVTYTWEDSNGNVLSGNNPSVNQSGIYTLTVLNNDTGCETPTSIEIFSDFTPPVAMAVNPGPIDCNNMSVNINAGTSTGSGTLTYAWSNGGSTTETLNVTAQGAYTVTVTAANGCTDETTITIDDNTTNVVVTAAASGTITCAEPNTILNVATLTGSNTPNYTWTDPNGTVLTGNSPSVNQAGTYELTIVDDVTGCSGTTTVVVIEDVDLPVAVIDPPANLTCTQGTVNLDGSGSSTGNNYIYQWFEGTTEVPSATTNLLSVTTAGNYTLVVTDTLNGCQSTSTITPVILDDQAPTAAAVAENNGVIICGVDELVIDGNTSTGTNITYQWQDAIGNVLGDQPTLSVNSSGDYTLIVTNGSNGCTNDIVIEITPDASVPSLSVEPVSPINCNSVNGMTDLVGTGASSNPAGTVTFQWLDSDGMVVSNTETYQTSTPGTYTFVVTDPGNNCEQSLPIVVVEDLNQPMVLPGDAQTIDCNNSTVTLNGSNSTSGMGITYQWVDEDGNDVPGATDPVFTTNVPGTYSLEVTNSNNGCVNDASVIVSENLQAPELGGMAANNIDCDNAEALVQGQVINSFSTTLGYQWTNSSGGILSSDINATVTSEGTVTLIVIDSLNGCSSTFDVPVINTTASPEVMAVASDNATLNCDVSGITLDGTGSLDSAGVTYSWTLNGNVVSNSLVYTTADSGLYILEVINANNGCTNTFNVLVEEDSTPPMADASANVDLLTCTALTSTLNGSNSSTGANFTYAWVDVNTGDTISNAITHEVSVASTYELIVTNTANGCDATSAQLVIDQSSDFPVAVAEIQNNFNLDCNNPEVTLDGSASTGTGTLTYQWFDANDMPVGNGESIVTVATPGEYYLNIVDGANGCDVNSNNITVIEDLAEPVVSAGMPTTLDCNQPMYTLDGTGSTLDPNITYTYEWTLAGNNVGNALTIADITQSGTYQLEITNTINGCTNTAEVVIGEDFDQPTADAGNNFTITCADVNAPLDGSASSTGGDFSYVWTNATGDTVSTNISDIINVPGDYTLVVTDNTNGCFTTSAPIQIGIDADLPAVEIATPAPIITCYDNQSVTLDGSGSDSGAGITYQWTLDGNDLVGETSAFLTTNQPGDYVLEIFNSNTGCPNAADITIVADLDAPTADAGTGGTLICGQDFLPLDGSASSSTGNFTYEWYSFDVANNTLLNPLQTGLTYNAGSAGDYVIVVTNVDNGCSSVSAPVEVEKDENNPDISVLPVAPLNCITDMVTVDASNSSVSAISTGTLIYEWTDANGNVIGNGPTINVMDPGSINLLITDDANNCTATTPVLVVEDIVEPLANAGSEATLFCNTNDVTLDGGGSAANMNYEWLDPSGMPVGGNSTTLTTAIPGTYTLIVTDPANGCTNEATVDVLQDINLPTANTVFNGEFNCNVDAIMVDGSTSVSPSGGTLEYLWSDGSNSATTTFMTAGDYTLTVTDVMNGCSSISAFTIGDDFSQPIVDVAGISNTTITCDNSSLVFNGGNSASSTGGAVTYQWLFNGTVIETMEEVEVGGAGDLVLVVTNVDNGCSASSPIIPIGIDTDVPSITIADPNEITCLDNTVILDGTGSTTGPDIEYLWTGPGTIENETTLMPTVSASGNYTLTLINTETGCQSTGVTFVDANINLPQANANATDEFDCVTDEVTLDGTGSATGQNITYTWTTSNGTFLGGSNTFNPTISQPGEYTIIVTNVDNGCTNEAVVAVLANTDVPVLGDYQVATPNCFGESNASILLNGTNGGQQPYLYSIDGGAFSSANQFSFLSSGTYNVIVQDANGCESAEMITIDEPGELLVELGDDITIGLGDTIDLSPQIIGAYDTIIWTNCVLADCFTPVLDSLGPINTSQYSVTLIDGNGCVATDDITVYVEKGREVFIPNVFTPNGDGNNDRFWVFAGQEAFKVHEFRVFNRWGEQVYATFDYDPQTQTIDNGWDGTFDSQEMNPAVFVYYVDIEYIDGRREVLKGDVALRR